MFYTNLRRMRGKFLYNNFRARCQLYSQTKIAFGGKNTNPASVLNKIIHIPLLVLLLSVWNCSAYSMPNDNIYLVFKDHLAQGLSMGLNTSGSHFGWLILEEERGTEGSSIVTSKSKIMVMNYPSNQKWGVVFITLGEPKDSNRPGRDYSNYNNLIIEMRGKDGNEVVQVGIKDNTDPDNGSETKILRKLSKAWTKYEFRLSDFKTADLKRLYVLCEFVFVDKKSTCIEVRSIMLTK